MAAPGRSGTIAFETAAPGEHVTRPPASNPRPDGGPNDRKTRRSACGDRSSVAVRAAIALRPWATGRPLGAKGRRSGSVIAVRRETWGAARFRRGLEAPAPTGQATRSGRRPRRAPGSSRRQRTGPPARPRGTSADGSGKAMPPSRGSWRGGRRERFASWFRSRKSFRWVDCDAVEVAVPAATGQRMAKAPVLCFEHCERCAHRVLGASADAAAARKAQPAARVEQQSGGNERERAGERGRAGSQGDDRRRTGRGRAGAAGGRSTQPAVLLAAGETRSDH